MINIKILENLSVLGAISYLLESGYVNVLNEEITNVECDIIIIEPFILYGENGNIIDQINYIEYCNYDEDNEPESYKIEWLRVADY